MADLRSEPRDMSWWVEHGLDDLISRVEIAARVEQTLDWYREHQPDNEQAENVLLDVLDVLCGFIGPHMQLKQSWPKPDDTPKRVNRDESLSAESERYAQLLEQVARDAELLLVAEDAAYPDAINACTGSLSDSLAQAKAHRCWPAANDLTPVEATPIDTGEAEVWALVDDHGELLGEYDTAEEAVRALRDLVAVDETSKDTVAVLAFDPSGKRVGKPITWKDLP